MNDYLGRGNKWSLKSKARALLMWLSGEGENAIAQVFGRSTSPTQNCVESMMWRLAGNYHNQGVKLVEFLKVSPLYATLPSREHCKWTIREIAFFHKRRNNRHANKWPALTDFELAILLRRSEGAVEKQEQSMFKEVKGFVSSKKQAPPRPKTVTETPAQSRRANNLNQLERIKAAFLQEGLRGRKHMYFRLLHILSSELIIDEALEEYLLS